MVSIAIKLKAFRIKHVLDLIYTAKWRYFAIFYIGFHLQKWNPAFASNLIPHSSDIEPFYAQCLKDFRAFVSLFPNANLKEVSSKVIYDLIIRSGRTVPSICKIVLLTSTGFGRMSIMIFSVLVFVILTGEWPRTSCHSTLTQNRTITDRCPLCKEAAENQLHLFLLCNFMKEVLSIVEKLISDIVKIRVTLTRDILYFNIFPPEVKKQLPLVLEVWSIYKHSVLIIRNRV